MFYHICAFLFLTAAYCYQQNKLSELINVTVNLVNTSQTVIFACFQNDLGISTNALNNDNNFVQTVIFGSNYTLNSILTHKNHARTSIFVNCACNESIELINKASNDRYLNKTYQWIFFDEQNIGIEQLFSLECDYLGPNAQVTYINISTKYYNFWDVHSKGRHLGSALEVNLIAQYIISTSAGNLNKLLLYRNIFDLQSILYRDQFKGLTLRGASVIDQDNITTNAQIESILSRSTKDSGVAAFIKYHYELSILLRERLNFTINFRNARGWAGRLGNARFRLGFLGIIMRNEADIGASGAFNRINRFAEFDTIHQGWKFEAAFLYRFTPMLDGHSENGNFFAPFHKHVWIYSFTTLIVINLFWQLVEWINKQCQLKFDIKYKEKMLLNNSLIVNNCAVKHDNLEIKKNDNLFTKLLISTIAAVCQQGVEPTPNSLPSRTILLSLLLFCLIMYNYYTSSVVGALLSSQTLGPSSVTEIVSSSLKLAFEDIGYYKVLFRENQSPLVRNIIHKKLDLSRDSTDLPIYTHINDAIPYIKSGSYAFHCEVVDAYPEIAKQFNANEICDLRVVHGLLETEILNWIVHKNSQYTEIFRIIMCRTREIGLINRLLMNRQPKKPSCQFLYTVYPVTLNGILGAFICLLAGWLVSILTLILECLIIKLY